MKRINASAVALLLTSFSQFTPAAEIKTNAVYMADAPGWLTPGRINGIVEHIQGLLEWDIRRVPVTWYKDEAAFEKVHGYGPTVLAVSLKSDNSIRIGPRVNSGNFDGVFGHELVHIISFQKYHEAIPKWLEEGLANYLSNGGKVDYKWLAGQPIPPDVRNLTHPFGGTVDNIPYHYMASQALAEMIAAKCDFSELLRLSVGRKLEDYLDKHCEIKDLNTEYKKWLEAHGKKAGV